MAKRRKKREREPAATVASTDADGGILHLRQELSAGTIRKIATTGANAAGSVDDAWRRRTEMLFEHLAVNWEVAGLPLTDQKMLLGRYRMADADTQSWVRQTITAHLEKHIPELADAL